ncbi:MAG: hypothetical protein GXO92_01050 [FCB group bacterium]|nr:hypothetical protein [FCB group bacterium]
MKRFLFIGIFAISVLTAEIPYFQQRVEYEISVTLNDSAHTLSAYESLLYINNSPDTLNFIWFHLWPNAYRNNETAFAKQKFKAGSTDFLFAEEEDRGFIDSLDFRVDGKRVKWIFHPDWIDVAKVYLPAPLVPGDSIIIETPFFVKLPKIFSRLGHSGKHYEITQWYPKPAVYDREGWHPMPYLDQGEFYSEFGSFDVYITLPENYRIMATGILVDGEEEYAWLDSLALAGDALYDLDKKAFKKKIRELEKSRKKKGKDKSQKATDTVLKTLHFRQDKVHDFAWFADPNWIVRKGKLFLADSTREVTLWSMYLPKNAELWRNSIEYIHDAGYWYSRFYGDYPYEHITAVDGDMSAGGGMEYPNITVISSGGSKDMLEYVIMHEVGHNWFYGILGSNERDHAWLDEGLNQYSNLRYWDKKYAGRNRKAKFSKFLQEKLGVGRNIRHSWLRGNVWYGQRALLGDDQPIDIPSQDFNRRNYGSIVYYKTAIFTRFLQQYLGEEKMNEIFRDYYETWKFKHPRPQDLKTIFNKHVDTNLDWYFDDVIEGTKVVDYSVKIEGDKVLVENLGTMSPPVEIAFYDEQGKELERRWLSGSSSTRAFPMVAGAKYVRIDPDNYMPDINRTNNSSYRPFDLHFVFDQPDQGKKEWYWLPWFLSWNQYNGWTPGVMLYSGYIPTYQYGISLVPMWDFNHNRLVGSVSAQKTMYRTLGFRSVTLGTGFSDYTGHRGVKISFRGESRKPVEETPKTVIRGKLYLHDIINGAVNNVLYSSGLFTIGKLGVEYSFTRSPLLKYSGSVGVVSSLGGASFSRIHVAGNVEYKQSKKMSTKIRGWVGKFINSRNIPNQYRTYLGGGVDPEFENFFVLDRISNDGKGSYNLYDEQFILDGPGLRGRALRNGLPMVSEALAWGLNLSQTLPKILGAVFVDLAGTSDLGRAYFDAGFVLKVVGIRIYVPLYQSWDDQTTPTDFPWIKERLRFELKAPSFSVR